MTWLGLARLAAVLCLPVHAVHLWGFVGRRVWGQAALAAIGLACSVVVLGLWWLD